ncbi:MAG: cytochrome c oxidase assembly protein [Chloroflexota bacterium]
MPAVPASAYAHPGLPPAPHDLLTAWAWEPAILLPLIVAGWLYARGVRALWRRAGPGRGISRWRAWACGGGLLTLSVALVSPVDALGSALLVGHMLQHTMLMLVAAPLLALGRPHTSFLWALRRPQRQRIGGWWRRRSVMPAGWQLLTHPVTAWTLHAGAIWLWHLPGPYQAALSSEPLHALEHASFLGTAVLFWWVLPGFSAHPRLNPASGILYLFTFTLQGGILGALMTFTGAAWYPVYAATAPAWGLTPLEDQQLAGLLMWIPSGLVYVIAALAPMARLLDAGNDSVASLERGPAA